MTFQPCCTAIANTETVDINIYHQILGHPGMEMVTYTAKKLGIKLTGETIKCVACALAKAKNKNINKTNLHRSTLPGERICIDISYVETQSLGGKKYWVLMVDEATGMKL